MEESINKIEERVETCNCCNLNGHPMVGICDCKEVFFHERCALQLIAMSLDNAFEIPCCSLCNAKYSVEVRVTPKRIDKNTLFIRCNMIGKFKIFLSIILFILVLTTPYFLLSHFKKLYDQGTNDLLWSTLGQIIMPMLFVSNSIPTMNYYMKMISDCKVETIEITLVPRRTVPA